MISVYSEPVLRYAIRCGLHFVAKPNDQSTEIMLTDDPNRAHYFLTIEKARFAADELKTRFAEPVRIVAIDLNF